MKLTIAIIAALTATTAAYAEQPSALVKYADLDLASPAGQAELERRVDTATRKVCRAQLRTGSRIPDNFERNRCLADVRQQVSEQLAR
jgi:UrcA family protein